MRRPLRWMTARGVLPLALLATVVLLAVACGGGESASQPDAASASPTFGRDLGDAANGQTVFDELCRTCHGPAGAGGLGPAVDSAEFEREYPNDAAIAAVVRTGKRAMPPFDTGKLTDQELADLNAYIRSLR